MISFVVPVYNVDRYIRRCIESILKQTNKNFEVVIVDDGSTDKSGRICDEYAEKYPCISVFHKENGGLASARNYALKHVNGEWIAFIDSDDWIEPHYVEEMDKQHILGSKCEVIVFGYYIDYVENGYSLNREFEIDSPSVYDNVPNAIEQMEIHGMFNSVWNKVYSNTLLQKYNISFNQGMEPGEDMLFNCEYFKKVSKCVLNGEKLYHYMRQGENTLTKKYDSNLYEKIKLFDQARVGLYQALKMNDEKYEIQLYRYYFSYITSCVHNNYGEANGLSYKEKVAFFDMLYRDNRLLEAINKMSNTSYIDTVYSKLFIALYKLKNAVIMEYIYEVLFWGRNHFKCLYNIFRKKVFQKDERV
jgi:glycosyltransferase involved in cell wall biosynthesis